MNGHWRRSVSAPVHGRAMALCPRSHCRSLESSRVLEAFSAFPARRDRPASRPGRGATDSVDMLTRKYASDLPGGLIDRDTRGPSRAAAGFLDTFLSPVAERRRSRGLPPGTGVTPNLASPNLASATSSAAPIGHATTRSLGGGESWNPVTRRYRDHGPSNTSRGDAEATGCTAQGPSRQGLLRCLGPWAYSPGIWTS
jgi:hypothetical protein